MRLAVQILISLIILGIVALTIFSPTLTEALAMLGLAVVCLVVAKKRGFKRAVILFLKEMW
jgi:hypothetical protein